jgi:hypothetical protein
MAFDLDWAFFRDIGLEALGQFECFGLRTALK